MASLKINNNGGTLIKSDIIEQRPDYLKTRHEYSNGWILVIELVAESANIFSNFNWILNQDDGSVSPDLNSPNLEFVDPL